MDTLLAVLQNAAALAAIGAVATFVWSIIQFILVRKRDQEHREFEIYHKLIKELVVPDPETKATWIDRQAAVAFELRRFKRYHELTLRILEGLRDQWKKNDPNFQGTRLAEEMDLTIKHIRRQVG